MKLEGNKVLVRSGGRTLEVADPSDAGRIARYMSFLQKLRFRDAWLVIWDLEGTSPERGELDSFLSRSRSVRFSVGFNAELCWALLKSRIDREQSQLLEPKIPKPS